MTFSTQLPRYAQSDLSATVTHALAEDIGDGDITARLIPPQAMTRGQVITRESATLCGQAWVEEVFRQIDERVEIQWHQSDGAAVAAGETLFSLTGPARALLTGERTALNFLQLLSGTATVCRHYSERVAHTGVKLLDTRKTIPGLRNAQKYAVTQGGCFNHRIGLYDAFLIKENHITACGGLREAIEKAREQEPNKTVEIEVENLSELEQALSAKADVIMLDNFDLDSLKHAVSISGGAAKLEASGGVTDKTLLPIAETGVDFISIGALTKDVKAIDLSMRLL